MGILRLFLAYIVLLSHAPEGLILKKISHPALAVQCFYVISGFYIQLLIRKFEKQDGKWALSFYKNRFLRLVPTYYLCLILTCILIPSRLNLYGSLDLSHKIFYIFNNLFILPQDWIYFFTKTDYTIMGISWTLSLEMMFYIVSPYLLTKQNRTLCLIIAASILCRLLLRDYDLYEDIWFYRFFPSEIAIFLCGALAYRFYQHYLLSVDKNVEIFLKISGFVILAYLLHMFMGGWHTVYGGHWAEEGKVTCGAAYKYWYMLGLTMISIPFIFKMSNRLKLDLYLGEFSYPVYLGHFMIIPKLSEYVSDDYLNLVALIVTIFFAYLVTKFIEIPFAKLRRSISYKESVAVEGESLPHPG